MKFTECKRVILTDYTEEILSLIQDNIKLMKSARHHPEVLLIDWTKEETYECLKGEPIDIIIATDVIYHGSPYASLAKLIKELAINST
jgi:predicted nicotinamide N-methyase